MTGKRSLVFVIDSTFSLPFQMANTKNESVANKDSSQRTDAPPAPPDGGWGWVVTFSSFMVSFLVDGVCFTFGLLFTEFLEYFGESKGKTSLLGSVLNGAYLSLGMMVL